MSGSANSSFQLAQQPIVYLVPAHPYKLGLMWCQNFHVPLLSCLFTVSRWIIFGHVGNCFLWFTWIELQQDLKGARFLAVADLLKTIATGSILKTLLSRNINIKGFQTPSDESSK